MHVYSKTLTQKMNRPTGVTIIAILAIISGILLLFGGLSLIGAGTLFSTGPADISNDPGLESMG
jgi:hypothetical protein